MLEKKCNPLMGCFVDLIRVIPVGRLDQVVGRGRELLKVVWRPGRFVHPRGTRESEKKSASIDPEKVRWFLSGLKGRQWDQDDNWNSVFWFDSFCRFFFHGIFGQSTPSLCACRNVCPLPVACGRDQEGCSD